jgi:phosphoribosylformimino-5-aminoimidazole carboxamide ribotide isomerase
MLKRDDRGGLAVWGRAVIPAIDLLGGRVVRLRQGRYDRVTAYAGDPVALAGMLAGVGSGWLHVVDLDAARSGSRSSEHERAIRDIAGLPGVRLQVGGGARSTADVEALWALGAERVVVGSLAAADPQAAGELARASGRIAVAADVGAGRVRTHGWERDSGMSAAEFVDRLVVAGVRDFLVTGIDRDGTGEGPDTDLLTELRPRIPGLLIAAGGVAGPADVAVAEGAGADAVVVGRALLDGLVGLPAGPRHPKE